MLEQVVVKQRTDSIVCRCHCMEVASKVEVDLFHRQYLCIAATSSATLNAETRTKRRLAQSYDGFLAYLVQPQRQANADGGLTNTSLCGADSCDQYQSALLNPLFVNMRYGNLGHVAAIRFYLLGSNAQL